MISDHGSNFVNKTIVALTEQFEIEHRRSTIYHPQYNGAIEAYHPNIEGAQLIILDQPIIEPLIDQEKEEDYEVHLHISTFTMGDTPTEVVSTLQVVIVPPTQQQEEE